jgi:hypothetical protein
LQTPNDSVPDRQRPLKAVLDDAMACARTSGDTNKSFDPLDELLATHG